MGKTMKPNKYYTQLARPNATIFESHRFSGHFMSEVSGIVVNKFSEEEIPFYFLNGKIYLDKWVPIWIVRKLERIYIGVNLSSMKRKEMSSSFGSLTAL